VQSRTPTVHIPFREAGRKAQMLVDLGMSDWLLDIDEMSSTGLLDVCLDIDRNFDASLARTDRAIAHVGALGTDVLQRVVANWKK